MGGGRGGEASPAGEPARLSRFGRPAPARRSDRGLGPRPPPPPPSGERRGRAPRGRGGTRPGGGGGREGGGATNAPLAPRRRPRPVDPARRDVDRRQPLARPVASPLRGQAPPVDAGRLGLSSRGGPRGGSFGGSSGLSTPLIRRTSLVFPPRHASPPLPAPQDETEPAATSTAPAPPPAAAAGAAALAASLLTALPAEAKDGALGILEGRSFALLHPVAMAALLGLTLRAGYTGLRVRRARDLGEAIRSLKAARPVSADVDGEPTPAPSSPELAALEAERSGLLREDNATRHVDAGSVLLAFGTLLTVEGCANTFVRTGRLFPGPHLYAGVAIVALWAAAAALAPAMQRPGRDAAGRARQQRARDAHLALNAANVALFLWQVPTGWEIVLKVFQFTQWP